MAPTIPTREPTKVVAGDTVQWTRDLSDYPASEYTLTYALVNASGQITITASADGDTHAVSEDTSDWDAGTYRWQSYVTKDSVRTTLETGTIEVKTDFASATSGYDDRSHVKKTLDALEAVIAGKATKDQLSSSVAGVSVSRLSPDELIRWRDLYKAEWNREKQAERIELGMGTSAKVRLRFLD